MVESAHALFDVFLMFAAAKAGGWLLERCHQPAVIGELLAGIAIGPYALGWLRPAGFHDVLAELGVVFLLFSVGLETRISGLKAVGRTAALVAVVGVLLPFAAGIILIRALNGPAPEALFLGAAMVATSVGVTARVLQDLNLLGTVSARVILGAAVIDDILGLLIVAVVVDVAKGSVSAGELALLALETIGFVGAVAIFGTRLARQHGHRIAPISDGEGPFVLAILLCLGLAALAGIIGLAAIIGAFLAGMVLAETLEHWDLETRIQPVCQFLVPLFFVAMGAQVNPRVLLHREAALLSIGVVLLAVASKVIGCGAMALPLGKRRAAFVGTGMVPRGEVGIIVGSLGLRMGVLPQALYSIIIAMSILTTLMVPPVLKAIARSGHGRRLS